MRRALPSLLTLVLGLAASASGAGAGGGGLLRIVATRGPVTPVCRVDVPCDGPAKAVQIVVRRSGAVVAHALTDAAGRARVPLPGGRYAVTATYAGGVGTAAQSKAARVVTGHTTTLTFSFDTGIR
jgi:hypothetical protein